MTNQEDLQFVRSRYWAVSDKDCHQRSQSFFGLQTIMSILTASHLKSLGLLAYCPPMTPAICLRCVE